MTSPYLPYRAIVAAEPAGERRVRITFDDGTTKTVDVGPRLGQGVFERLAVDDEAFNELYVDRDTVCWPGDLDLAPELFDELPDVS